MKAPAKGSPRPLTETSFASAWQAGHASATAFLDDGIRDVARRREAVSRAAARTMSPALVDAIAAQNARLPPSLARARAVEALRAPGTVVVVTGQQLGLFLGPLFTLYKAASAIRLAELLARETGARVVPVFWLQNEDHDFEEVRATRLPGGDEGVLTVALDADPSRVPVGERIVGPSVTHALALLERELGQHPHARAHLELLARAYRTDATHTEAFSRLLAEVFSEHGLVVVDPRDPALARFAAPVHRRALLGAREIARALEERSRALVDAGFAPQVHVRPDAPLSFFAPDGPRGPRHRLAPVDDGAEQFSLVGEPGDAPAEASGGRRFSRETLAHLLDDDPLRFSTSALLRPIVQDTFLPTAAYVGGPGECAYFAQLAPLYRHFDVHMPLFAPRARFRLLDDRARALLAKLALEPADVSRPRDELLAAVGAGVDDEHPPADLVESELLSQVRPALSAFSAKLGALDPSLSKAAAKCDDVITDAVKRLVAKYARALAQRDAVTAERVARLVAMLAPEGAPQERVFGMSYYAARVGTEALVRAVVDATDPLSPALTDLSL